MISDEDLKNRLRFVMHKGRSIFLIDFSQCQGRDMLVLLDQVRADVAQHEPGTVLTLADFTGAKIDKEVATKIKEVLTLDRPYVKKSAWVGTDSLPHVFYENFKTFSRRDFPTFETREQAMDWLVQE
jgi:hypothetical protein